MPTDRQQALQAYQTVYEELAADRQMLFDNGYGYTFPYATDPDRFAGGVERICAV